MVNVRSYYRQLKRAFFLAHHAFGAYKNQVLLLAFLGFLAGMLGGIGVNALIPLISFLIGSRLSTDPVTLGIQKVFETVGLTFSFQTLFALIAVLIILQCVTLILFDYIKIKIVAGYEARTQKRLFQKTLESEWRSLLTQKIGHLETMIMTNTRMSSAVLERTAQLIISATGIVVYTIIVFSISPTISSIAFALGVLLLFIFRPILSRARSASRETEQVNKESAHFVNEQIIGMKSVKSLHAERTVTVLAGALFENLRRLRIRTFLLRSINSSLFRPIGLLFVGMIFALSFRLAQFEFAVLLAVIYLVQNIFSYFQQFLGQIHLINEAVPFLSNLLAYEERLDREQERDGGHLNFTFQRELRFKNVSFAYTENQDVLSEISFSLIPGDFVGLVGPSGGGKTTIVDLLLRLFQPTSGTITLDGSNIETIRLSEWRKHVGYVSQDVFLLNSTIEKNIKFFDDSISNEDMIEAAKMANIYEDIQEKLGGFTARVGERGNLLSVGQRQRVALARILARKPTILILDEATSALDSPSAREIQKTIDNLKGKITIFAIAHKFSAIQNADLILVLSNGKIVESGKPELLLANKKSFFSELHESDKGSKF